MKKLPYLIITLILITCFSFTLSSCKKTETKALSVDEALEINNGKSVLVEGTVFYKTSEGFYLTSGDAYIFCYNPSNDVNNGLEIGDAVSLCGYYSFFESQAKITNIESYEVLSNNNNLPTPSEEAILDITKKEKTEKDFYSKYITLKGKVIENDGSFYLVDEKDNKIEILNESSENVNKVIKANYVVSGYDDGFTLYRTSEALEYSYKLADILPLIEIELNDNPSIIYDKISLVTKSSIKGVTYSYKIEDENINLSEFKQVEAKTTTKLITTVSYNDEVKEISKDITFYPDTTLNVSEFLANKPTVNYSNISMTGTVVAKLSNSSKTVYSLVIKDINTNDKILLVFRSNSDLENNIGPTDKEFTNISVGFNITFKARYNTTGDYMNTLDGITSISNDGVLRKITDDYSDCYTLSSREDYVKLSTNYEEYFGKLIKFESPYLCYSASAGVKSSYVLPLYTKDSSSIYSSRIASIDEEDGTITYKTLSFSVDGNDESYGDSSWREMFDISTKNYDYNKINASIYCYLVPSTGSRIQLVIPSKDYLNIYNENNEFDETYDKVTKINASLEALIDSYIYENTTLDLPKTVYNTEITYDKGYSFEIELEAKPRQEIIKASYSINDKIYTKDVIINVIGSSLLQIKQIRNYSTDEVVYGKGIVIGFASETLSSNETTTREYKGLIVKDLYNKECIILDGLEYYLGDTYPDFTVNNHEINVGTTISFKGRYSYLDSRVTIRYDGEIKYIGEDEIEYYDEDFIVANDTLSLSEAIYEIDEETKEDKVIYARLIKLVGTESNPIYFTPTSSNEEKSSGKMNFRIHYNGDATSACDAMFDGYSITLKQDNQAKNVNLEDETWYQSLGLPEIGTSGEMYPGAMAFTGEMYIVVCYKSSGSDGINCFYNSCSIVNFENWTLQEYEIDSSIEYGD